MRDPEHQPLETVTSQRRNLDSVREVMIELGGELNAASSRRAFTAIDTATAGIPAIVHISLQRIEKARWDGICLLVDAVRSRRQSGTDVRITGAAPRLAQLLQAAEHIPAFA
jgi:ABC-type transporter Mla MlaB component